MNATRRFLEGRARGDQISATVLSTHSFGCLLELADDVQALMELVEMDLPRPMREQDLPQPGTVLDVYLNAYDSVTDKLFVTQREQDWTRPLASRHQIPAVDT